VERRSASVWPAQDFIQSLYNRFIRWSRLGVFDRIFVALTERAGRSKRLMILPIVKIMYPHGIDIPAGAGWAAMEFRVEPSNLVPAGYVPLPFMHAFVVGVVGVVLVGMAVALLRSLGRSLLRGVKRRTQMQGS